MKIMEVIGGPGCSVAGSSTPTTASGIRALLLFGTEEQSGAVAGLVSGKELAAFALTDPEAGSMPHVQTTAHRLLMARAMSHGEKRYITNVGIAHVLTVMARTPVAGSPETR